MAPQPSAPTSTAYPPRRFPRARVDLPALVRLVGEARRYEDFAKTKSLGAGGCMLVTSEPVGLGSMMEVLISLEDRVIRADSHVVWERSRDGSGDPLTVADSLTVTDAPDAEPSSPGEPAAPTARTARLPGLATANQRPAREIAPEPNGRPEEAGSVVGLQFVRLGQEDRELIASLVARDDRPDHSTRRAPGPGSQNNPS